MALTKCNECGHGVSSAAKACPSCGAPPPKKTSPLTWVIGGLFAAWVGSMVMSPKPNTPPQPQKSAAQIEAEAKREAAFQRTVAVVRALKSSLREPASAEWESIRSNSDASLVCVEYRARNGFGGMNREVAIVRGDKVSERTADWNKHCTAPLLDMKHARRAI